MKMIGVLKDELRAVTDPRVLGRTRHLLIDILVIGVLAVICHAETWEEMEEFAKAREDWLKQFLDLRGGIPSHDTIGRVFSLIRPRELEMAFISWVKQAAGAGVARDTIGIDGKSLRGTSEPGVGHSRKSLNVVSAWSTARGIVLGQVKSNGRGHSEVSAALELLDMLNIKNMIVVADAGVGRESVVKRIVAGKGDYVFPIKSNSRRHFDEVVSLVDNTSDLETYCVREDGHGRKEVRTISVVRRAQFPEKFNKDKNKTEHFKKLKAVGKVVYEREFPETAPFRYVDGSYKATTNPIRRETETRYFITSLKLSPKGILGQLRLQWAIENQLHWSLDVQLGEDANKTRNKIAAENLAVARKIALNLVKQDKSSRIGVKSKLKRAGWDLNYLESLLFMSTF